MLTHVLHNRNPYPFLKKAGSFNYLQNGRLLPTCDANGVVLVTGDFEDTWNRGVHDGKAIANEMIKLAGGTTP